MKLERERKRQGARAGSRSREREGEERRCFLSFSSLSRSTPAPFTLFPLFAFEAMRER